MQLTRVALMQLTRGRVCAMVCATAYHVQLTRGRVCAMVCATAYHVRPRISCEALLKIGEPVGFVLVRGACRWAAVRRDPGGWAVWRAAASESQYILDERYRQM